MYEKEQSPTFPALIVFPPRLLVSVFISTSSSFVCTFSRARVSPRCMDGSRSFCLHYLHVRRRCMLFRLIHPSSWVRFNFMLTMSSCCCSSSAVSVALVRYPSFRRSLLPHRALFSHLLPLRSGSVWRSWFALSQQHTSLMFPIRNLEYSLALASAAATS